MIVLAIAVTLLLPGPWCARARADGGTVQLVQRHGDYQISVFTAPNPLRAGPVDISVLVQDGAGQPVPEVQITVAVAPADGQDAPVYAVATTEAATNKLLRSALIELPHPGAWNVQVTTTMPRGAAESRFMIVAGPPLPPWLSVWPWFTWPAVAVALFGAHRWLVARKT